MTLVPGKLQKTGFAKTVIRHRMHFHFLFERDAKQDEAEKACGLNPC